MRLHIPSIVPQHQRVLENPDGLAGGQLQVLTRSKAELLNDGKLWGNDEWNGPHPRKMIPFGPHCQGGPYGMGGGWYNGTAPGPGGDKH
eukprot:gene7285-biopygen15074